MDSLIPIDKTIIETINKDTQTSGGTKGFSLKVSKEFTRDGCPRSASV